jgi:hypothetical protein
MPEYISIIQQFPFPLSGSFRLRVIKSDAEYQKNQIIFIIFPGMDFRNDKALLCFMDNSGSLKPGLWRIRSLQINCFTVKSKKIKSDASQKGVSKLKI